MRAHSSHRNAKITPLSFGDSNSISSLSAAAIVLNQDATKNPVGAFNCLKIKISYNIYTCSQTEDILKKPVGVFPSPRNTTHGVICLIPSLRNTTHGVICLIPSSRNTTHEVICLIPSPRNTTHGVICLIPSPRNTTHGVICLIPSPRNITQRNIYSIYKLDITIY